MTTEVLPVTKEQSTRTEIDYSVKIGKQVIKKQLEADILAMQDLISKNTELQQSVFSGSRFCNMLEEEAEKLLEADEEITTLRTIFSKHLTHMKFDRNLELMDGSINTYSILDGIRGRLHALDEFEELEEIIESGVISVDFDFCVNLQNECSDERPSFIYEIKLSDEWLKSLSEYLLARKDKKELLKGCSALVTKLANLDSVMEEVEATILANELRQSESGRKVLEISAGIIGNILGGTPSLLSLEDK